MNFIQCKFYPPRRFVNPVQTRFEQNGGSAVPGDPVGAGCAPLDQRRGRDRNVLKTLRMEETMLTYVMLTRLSPGALLSPRSLEELEQQVKKQIKTECPEVEWVHNYAILGDCDYLDIFTAPDMETALKVATIVRTFGHSHTEIWTATEWRSYKDVIRHLPQHAAGGMEPPRRVEGAHGAQQDYPLE
jgi:uncharacterized protein with GYD domain